MDTSALLSGGLQAGLGLFNQGMSQGSAKGMGSGVGSAAGGLLGTAVGGPLGTMIGSTVGGLAGGGLEQLLSGGGKKKKPKAKAKAKASPAKAAVKAAATPGAVKRTVAQTAAATGVSSAKVAGKVAGASQAIQAAKALRFGTSDALGASIAAAPNGYAALAVAAGVSPQAAAAARLPPGLLVRRAGLDRIGKAAGLGGAVGLVQATGLDPRLVRASGLHLSAMQHKRLAPMVSRAVRVVVAKADPVTYDIVLSGVSDGPSTPGGKSTPGLNVAEGDIPKPRTPGAVPVRAEQWRLDEGVYVLAWGDTLTGLAVTYLGNGGRLSLIHISEPTRPY